MDTQQFYPTPPTLAKRLWALFKNKDFSRVLEPSAGRGDLIKAMPGFAEKERYRYRSEIPVDVIEIDMGRHSALRELGVQVVGLDFLEHTSGSIYSHIILNPPFNAGATHCLKAWDLLWSGEVAAILAAETIRNPFSAERKRLVKLIEAHGSVEFVQEAFLDPDTQRKTAVEVALVWLEKTAPLDSLLGDLIGEMREDGTSAESLGREWKQERELALPNNTIQNAVVMFNAAVRSMKESVQARAKANYYARLMRRSKKFVATGEEDFDYCYPLQLIGWSRPDCVTAIAEVLGAEIVPVKSACYFCPASKVWELYWLAAEHPDLLEKALHLERVALTGRHSRFDSVEFGASWEELVKGADRFPSSNTTVGLGRSFAWNQWAWSNGVVDANFKVKRSQKTVFAATAKALSGVDNALDSRKVPCAV